MMCKGVVKGNMVILEEGAHLPDGATVMVSVEPVKQNGGKEVIPEEIAERRALVAQMKEFGQRLA